MADQCYFNGDFYYCVAATTPGDSPTTAPAKWQRIRLPGKWRWVLAQLTYANLLVLDGQMDKATLANSRAYGRERVGLEDLIRTEANEQERRHGHGDRISGARVGAGASLAVKAAVILDDAYRLIGWDSEQIDDREKADARASLSLAVQEVWEAWWWQELMDCAPVQFAGHWLDVENYPMPVCYYGPTDKYYLAANDSLGTPAATDGTTSHRWVEYFTAAWPEWFPGSYAITATVSHAGKLWFATDPTSEEPTLAAVSWVEFAAWTPILPDPLYLDNPTAGIFGPIRSVSVFDPRANTNPQCFELNVTADGTEVLGLTVTHPWVWSRQVTPILTGDAYDASATYDAVSYIPDPTDDMGRHISNSVSLNIGTDTGIVTFSSTAPAVPLAANLTVSAPAGGANIFASLVEGTLNANGFHYTLSALVPDVGYKLQYQCDY